MTSNPRSPVSGPKQKKSATYLTIRPTSIFTYILTKSNINPQTKVFWGRDMKLSHIFENQTKYNIYVTPYLNQSTPPICFRAETYKSAPYLGLGRTQIFLSNTENLSHIVRNQTNSNIKITPNLMKYITPPNLFWDRNTKVSHICNHHTNSNIKLHPYLI